MYGKHENISHMKFSVAVITDILVVRINKFCTQAFTNFRTLQFSYSEDGCRIHLNAGIIFGATNFIHSASSMKTNKIKSRTKLKFSAITAQDMKIHKLIEVQLPSGPCTSSSGVSGPTDEAIFLATAKRFLRKRRFLSASSSCSVGKWYCGAGTLGSEAK